MPQKIKHFLMLPLSSTEILFLGGSAGTNKNSVMPFVMRIREESNSYQFRYAREIGPTSFISYQNCHIRLSTGHQVLTCAHDSQNPRSITFSYVNLMPYGNIEYEKLEYKMNANISII